MPYQHILIATDFSPAADDAAGVGADLALRLGARVTLLHAIDSGALEYAIAPLAIGREALEQQMITSATAGLEQLATKRFADVRGIDCHTVIRGSAARAIIAHAENYNVDLCVMATHGRTGLKRLFAGSVTEAVVRDAPCDVLSVRQAPESWPPKQVVAGSDFSEASTPAVARAVALGRHFEAGVRVIHVHDDTVPVALNNGTFERLGATHERLQGDAEKAVAHLQPTPDIAILNDAKPAETIAGCADAEMIVVGTHGRSGLPRMLLGSVATRMVRVAQNPVLVVRSHRA